MKPLALAAALAVSAVFGLPATALADGCYICQTGSSCGQQCRYGAKDTQAARKACEQRGCKIGGTTSCSKAVNVKVCAAPESAPVQTASLQCSQPSVN